MLSAGVFSGKMTRADGTSGFQNSHQPVVRPGLGQAICLPDHLAQSCLTLRTESLFQFLGSLRLPQVLVDEQISTPTVHSWLLEPWSLYQVGLSHISVGLCPKFPKRVILQLFQINTKMQLNFMNFIHPFLLCRH